MLWLGTHLWCWGVFICICSIFPSWKKGEIQTLQIRKQHGITRVLWRCPMSSYDNPIDRKIFSMLDLIKQDSIELFHTKSTSKTGRVAAKISERKLPIICKRNPQSTRNNKNRRTFQHKKQQRTHNPQPKSQQIQPTQNRSKKERNNNTHMFSQLNKGVEDNLANLLILSKQSKKHAKRWIFGEISCFKIGSSPSDQRDEFPMTCRSHFPGVS